MVIVVDKFLSTFRKVLNTKKLSSASYTRGGKGGGGGGGQFYIFYYLYTHTYFCIFMYVLEALQFYIALHIHS